VSFLSYKCWFLTWRGSWRRCYIRGGCWSRACCIFFCK